MTDDTPAEIWELKLYIAGLTPQSQLAMRNLKEFCAEYLEGEVCLEIVDLLKHPERAKEDQIVALPTLVKISPPPFRKLIGDLSNLQRVLTGFDIREMACPSL
jgi:circadian clock protein KaiB